MRPLASSLFSRLSNNTTFTTTTTVSRRSNSSKSTQYAKLLANALEIGAPPQQRIYRTSSCSPHIATTRIIRQRRMYTASNPLAKSFTHSSSLSSSSKPVGSTTFTDQQGTIMDPSLQNEQQQPPPDHHQIQQQHELQHSSANDNNDNDDTTTTTTTTLLQDIPGTRMGGSRTLAILYTCGVCDTRSMKQFTERAYRHGVVMVQCPGCQNWHLIADHLGYFEEHDLRQHEVGGDDAQQQQQQQQQQQRGSTTTRTHWDIFEHLRHKQQGSSSEHASNMSTRLNAKIVTAENVWELTPEDIMGQDKYRQLMDTASDDASNDSDDDGNVVQDSNMMDSSVDVVVDTGSNKLK